ncbi:MAG: pyridoxal phosphate-dependent aminotransferase [Oscillospiraceae bacterium]|nr:pyridoxal phosphate-dependent aminotransferase [Oscillospiraceae bacterium]
MKLSAEKIQEYFKVFDKGVDRRNTDCVKWDCNLSIFGREDVLPYGVADTDFEVPSTVKKAMMERVEHGAFGYTIFGESYKKATVDWMKIRHGVDVETEWVFFSPGVIDSLTMAVSAYTEPGDKIAMFTPVYGPFYSVINQNECELCRCPLIKTENGWQIDFNLLEEIFKKGVKIFMLCSPHNPVGRVWHRDELETIHELAVKYNVRVFSDEIHSDVILPGNKHIPWIDIDPDGITLISATKAFNIAGLRSSSAIIPNEDIRKKVTSEFDKFRIKGVNLMGLVAQRACYETGAEWLDALCMYLDENRKMFEEYMTSYLPEFGISILEGTYLEWIDLSALGLDHDETRKWCADKGVGLVSGTDFGDPEGLCHARMNIATTRSNLEEGLKRLCSK